MSVTYDEKVIVNFAERLYQRATFIVALYVALGAVLGAVAGIGASLPPLIVAVIGALLGGLVGNERAFALRLMAQTALCQTQIERNTRPAMGSVATHSSENPREVAAFASERPVQHVDAQSNAEAQALVKRAQDHHFAKEFSDAVALYEEVVTRFPDSKQAILARTQLKNLK